MANRFIMCEEKRVSFIAAITCNVPSECHEGVVVLLRGLFWLELNVSVVILEVNDVWAPVVLLIEGAAVGVADLGIVIYHNQPFSFVD